MPTGLTNSLLPGYTAKSKLNQKNGYSSIFDTGGSNSIDNRIKLLSGNPSLQERYKDLYSSGDPDPAKTIFNTGSGPMVPDGSETNPVKLGDRIIYPWEPEYINALKSSGGNAPTTSVSNFFTGNDLTEPWWVSGESKYKNQLNPQGNNPVNPPMGVKQDLNPNITIQNSEIFDKPIDTKPLNTPTDPVITDSNINTDPAETTDPGNTDASSELNDEVLRQIDLALKGGGLPGTETATSEMREVLANFAKDRRAQAGLGAAMSGSIGQGAQYGAANLANKNIMQQLASTERDIAGMKAQDARLALDKGRSVFESDRDFVEGKRTFDESLQVQKDQLTQQTSESNLRSLEGIAGDNPVLLSKLIDARLGKEGLEFDETEQKQLVEYYNKKAARQEKLDEAELAALEALPEIVKKQITSITKPTTGEKRDDLISNTLYGAQDEEGNFDPDYEVNVDDFKDWTPEVWSQAKEDPDQWAKINETLPQEQYVAYRSAQDLIDAGYKVDEYVEKEKRATSPFTSNTSVFDNLGHGAGEGSIVMIEGAPHRIVKVVEMTNTWAMPDEKYTTTTYRNLTKDPDEPGYETSKKIDR